MNDHDSHLTDIQPPMKRFVSIGECMVELAPGATADDLKLGFAGDTFNTAWYVKALAPKSASRFVSRIGTDDASDRMLAMMDAAGIDTDHILRETARSVGLYLISLKDGERSFSYWRDNSAARLLAQDRAALEAATADTDLIYLSGITMAILDAQGRATLLDVMRRQRALGKTIAFDPNLRPRLWASSAEMCATVMEAAAVSDIVLPSYDDEAAHFGDATITATRDRYAQAGASTVIVKDGAGDVYYLRDGITGSVATRPVSQIVDTTAAGDSFNAGVFVGLDRGIEAAISLGAKVAGHAIGQKGALVPLPAMGIS